MSDKTYENILARKQEGKDWDLFFKELFDYIDEADKFKKQK